VLRSAPGGIQHGGPVRPFDHTSIIRTLRDRFDSNGAPLTGRDASAPSLDLALTLNEPSNDGPDQIDIPPYTPTPDQVQRAKDRPPNDLQRSLCALTAHLPQAGTDILGHIDALARRALTISVPEHNSLAEAENFAREALRSFLDHI
jgi:hypothetical protein